MTTASALVLEGPRRMRIDGMTLPDLGDDDGLLRVEACGLCGTDHEQYTGALGGNYPFVPGHETVGVIEAIGPGAAARWGVQVGDRVAVESFLSCGACGRCRAGDTLRCRNHGLHDAYGFAPVSMPPGLWGGYAEYQYLAPDSLLLPVPEGLDPIVATAFNPLGAGICWGVTVPGTKEGDVVAVLGPGIRGLSVVAAVKRAGAAFVLITGVGPHDDERLALAREFGADVAVDVTKDDPVRVLRDTAGRLADVVVDVTARAPAALAQGVALARSGGTLVLAGTRGSPDTPGFNPDAVVFKELRIRGVLGVDADAHREALVMLGEGAVPFAGVPRRTAPLDGAEDLLRLMAGEGDTPPPVHGVIVPA
jgi:alcohol dehydrogenase